MRAPLCVEAPFGAEIIESNFSVRVFWEVHTGAPYETFWGRDLRRESKQFLSWDRWRLTWSYTESIRKKSTPFRRGSLAVRRKCTAENREHVRASSTAAPSSLRSVAMQRDPITPGGESAGTNSALRSCRTLHVASWSAAHHDVTQESLSCDVFRSRYTTHAWWITDVLRELARLLMFTRRLVERSPACEVYSGSVSYFRAADEGDLIYSAVKCNILTAKGIFPSAKINFLTAVDHEWIHSWKGTVILHMFATTDSTLESHTPKPTPKHILSL